jgi:hypothetical protein
LTTRSAWRWPTSRSRCTGGRTSRADAHVALRERRLWIVANPLDLAREAIGLIQRGWGIDLYSNMGVTAMWTDIDELVNAAMVIGSGREFRRHSKDLGGTRQ